MHRLGEPHDRLGQDGDALGARLGRGVLAGGVADAVVLARNEDHARRAQRSHLLGVVAGTVALYDALLLLTL